MTKKKIAGTKNVYELAQERLKVIFNEFDNIYVSFSGGKDSGVLLNMCIDYIRKNNLKVRLGVFHMDYEIQYKMTIDYVDRMLEANKDILDEVLADGKGAILAALHSGNWELLGGVLASEGYPLISVALKQNGDADKFINDQRRFSFL